jgi:hypothetical protein
MTRESLAAFQAAAQEANEAFRGEEITIGTGEPIMAAITLGREEVEQRDGGFRMMRTLTATIRKTIWEVAPAEGQSLMWQDTRFVIRQVTGDGPDAAVWTVRARLA